MIVISRLENSVYDAIKNNKKKFQFNGMGFDLTNVKDRKYCKETLEISLKQIRNNLYYGRLYKEIIEETIMKLDNPSLFV